MTTKPWGDDKTRVCSLCNDDFVGMGNNPEPLAEFEQRCCDDCNSEKVFPARLARLARIYKQGETNG